jgi:Cu(I)/Ag(I) efflux system membrane protein CusA/SilA
MIARVIAWSARNLLLVLFGTGFAAAAGIYALVHLPLDAIPDLSDTQVIIYTEYPGQAPQVIEDQVTYPLSTAMLTVPKSKVVRGFSFFGVSFVYVIFEDGTDIYWARSRVLEFLNGATSRLPICRDVEGTKSRRHADNRRLESQIRRRQGRGSGRSRQRRRFRQAVQRGP